MSEPSYWSDAMGLSERKGPRARTEGAEPTPPSDRKHGADLLAHIDKALAAGKTSRTPGEVATDVLYTTIQIGPIHITPSTPPTEDDYRRLYRAVERLGKWVMQKLNGFEP